MEVDTESLAEGQFITFVSDPGLGDEGEVCPRCHIERSDWDCEGCGYEFPTPLKKPGAY